MRRGKTMSKECMFHKEGRCNSDYGFGISCDGLDVPEKCPYPNKKKDVNVATGEGGSE